MRKLKRWVYLKRLFRLQEHFKNKRVTSIIISGHSHGAAWLKEIICHNQNVFDLWEQLHPKMLSEYSNSEIDYFPYFVPKQKKNDLLLNYFSDITQGKFISEKLFQQNERFKEYNHCNTILLKFSKLSPLLTWVNTQFPELKIMPVHRHPLAVISSQIRHGEWNLKDTYDGYPDEPLKNSFFPQFFKQFEDVLNSVRTPEEYLAVNYALDVLPISFGFEHDNIHMIKYEAILSNPEKEMTKIFDFFNLKTPDNLKTIDTKPSATTTNGSAILSGENFHENKSYLKYLDRDQIDRIFNILTKFGFNKINEFDYELTNSRLINLYD